MKLNCVIKAFATNEEGLGKVSRAYCLAEELHKRGIKVSILTNEPLGKKYFKGFHIHINTVSENGGIEEETALLKHLSDSKTILVLTDYSNISHYFHALHPYKLVLLSDEVQDCDISVDLFISSLLLKRPSLPYIKHAMCGVEYHFIKKDIYEASKVSLNHEPKNILLTMGGSDNKELTVALTAMLYSVLRNSHFTVLLGTSAKRIGFTEKRISGISDDIEINRNAKKVQDRFNNFDLAFCKGGVTCYELMHLGVPLLSVSTSDYQKEVLQHLDEKGALIYAGHWDRLTIDLLKQKVEELSCDFTKRSQLSENARNMIDGKGIFRVVDAIESL